jgi:hypothetical protein
LRSRTDYSRAAVISTTAGALILVVSIWTTLGNTDGLTFFFDEWDFLIRRGISIDGLLQPHNGHLSTIPVISYVALRDVFGTGSYVPYQLLGISVHTLTCVVAARIVHRRSPVLALALLPVLVLLGAGWQNILWPFQIGMMGALLFGLLAIDEASRDNPRDRTATWVVLALLCAGGGVAVASAVTISTVLRRQWRLLRIMVAVLVCYAVWYLMFGTSQSQPGNLARTPKYVFDSAVWSAAGIGSWSFGVGKMVLVVALVVMAGTIFLRCSDMTSRALCLMLLMVITTWTLTGISRSHLAEPQASRYVYVGAIVLVTCTGLALSTFKTWMVLPLVFCALPFTLPSSISQMEKGAGGLRDTSFHVRSALAALDMTDIRPTNDFAVDARAPQMAVSAYDQLAEFHGKIGFTIQELKALPDPYRNTNDNMFNQLGVNQVTRSTGSLCREQSKALGGARILMSGETMVLLPDVETEIRLVRFSNNAGGVVPVTLNSGTWYSITNRADNDIPGLRFELPLTGVAGCVLGDSGAD